MECDKGNNYDGYDLTFMGAIFMSNRETKRECFERRLFGLPYVQAGFVKKIKAGMLLFLFEHEERKLYGVFEATSDGAMNIVPNAFRSTGKSFPAQIHFKRIWRCKPLSECEFGDVIRENYYQPYKFNFGLSYKQVLKLIQLFSSKKINLGEGQNYQNNLMAKFEKSNLATSKMTGKDGSFYGLGCKMLNDLNSHQKRFSADHRIRPSVYYNCDFPSSEDCWPGVKREQNLKPPVQCASDMQQQDFRCSTSQTDGALCRSFPNLGHDYSCGNVLSGSRVEQPSTAFVSSCLSSAHELAPCSRTALDAQAPYFRTLFYSSNKGLEIINYPYNDYPNVGSPSSRGTCKNLSIPVYEHLKPTFTSSDYSSVDLPKSERNCGSLSVPIYNDLSKPRPAFMSFEDYFNVRGHNGIPIPEHLNSAVPQKHLGLVAAKDDLLHSRLSPVKGLSYGKATQQEDDSRGYQCRHFRPASDYIPLSMDENFCKDSEITRPLSSTKEEASDTDCSFSDSQEDDDYEGLRPFHSASGPGYPSNSEERHLYLDDFKRVSVFSRLSKNSVPHGQGVRCRIKRRLALDELVELLSQRKHQWNEEVPMQAYQDDDENLKYSSDIESGEPEEKSNILFNFKRRSEISKLGCRGQKEEVCDDVRQKRRRFVRPSFDEEQPLCKENVEVKSSSLTVRVEGLYTSAQVENTKNGDLPVSYVGDPNNTSDSDACFGDVVNLRRNAVEFSDSNCDAYKTDEKDVVMPDVISQPHSAKFEISTGASADLQVEEMSAVRDEIFIPLVQTKFEAQKSNEVCDENVAMLDRGTTNILVKDYIKYSQAATENLNDGEKELNRNAVVDGNITVLSDNNFGDNSDDNGQKNAIVSDGSTLTLS